MVLFLIVPWLNCSQMLRIPKKEKKKKIILQKNYLQISKQSFVSLQFAAFPQPPLDFQLQFILIKNVNTPSLMVSFVTAAFFWLKTVLSRVSPM